MYPFSMHICLFVWYCLPVWAGYCWGLVWWTDCMSSSIRQQGTYKRNKNTRWYLYILSPGVWRYWCVLLWGNASTSVSISHPLGITTGASNEKMIKHLNLFFHKDVQNEQWIRTGLNDFMNWLFFYKELQKEQGMKIWLNNFINWFFFHKESQ